MELTCAKCGTTVQRRSPSQKYCSKPCQLRAIHDARIDRNVQERPCEVCGAVFRPRPGSAGRFCSRPCTFAGQRGTGSALYKGGRLVNSNGYVWILNPTQDGRQYLLEHRHVMEQKLGRSLASTETVHHINGDKLDNRPENLELWSGRHPKGQRHDDPPHCPTCTCGGAH